MFGKITSLFVIIFFLIVGCKPNPTIEETEQFQKSALLTDLTNELILPNYRTLQSKVNDLIRSLDDFDKSVAGSDFETIQLNWTACNTAFQAVRTYEFGPAMEIGFRAAFGTFPTDTARIESNISSGGYNLGTASNTQAIGLPALEYLLFRNGAENIYENDQRVANYVQEVCEKMSGEIDYVVNGWDNGYAATFKASTGTESNSGFSLLVNEFNKEYELAKNAKIGIPLGKKSLGIPQPEFIEAPYSKQSLNLLQEAVIQMQRIFNGVDAEGIDHTGFDDYLIALDRKDLVDEINSEMTVIINDLNQINGSFEEALITQNEALQNVYVKIADMVVHFKTDMTSAFGVLITYQDNDGD